MKIKILGLRKAYLKKEVLHINNLEFDSGRVYALMGLNGSGKTTLLHCIAGLEEHSDGEILYNGCPFEQVKKEISIMLQKPYMFHTSVRENLKIGMKFRKLREDVIEQRLEHYLRILNIGNLLDKNAKDLSGGEQEKVSLIRTAVLETEITMLDEPTASMDMESTLRAESLIRAIAGQEKTVIMVTHDFLQAQRIADHIIFMDQGRIIEQGKVDEVFVNPKHHLLKQMIKGVVNNGTLSSGLC